MKVDIRDLQGNAKEAIELKFPLITNRKGLQAVHEVVTAYRAAQRSGTACTKTMGEVAGTGKKPWRQKGTGRARAGSFQSPLWRGGGVVFGPKPRDFTKKVNKKTKRLALQKAISDRLSAGEVIVVDEIKLQNPKTKEFLALLKNLNLTSDLLVVVDKPDDKLILATRNIPDLEVVDAATVNVYQILLHEKILFSKPGFELFEKRLIE
jgi:large subunit ribosomal protein L4